MADAAFEDPRLAELYDVLDGDRSDLDLYVGLVDEFGARTVLDVGCGTGTFACLLAGRGLRVVGVDPAEASLQIARAKPYAENVRWLHGNASFLPPLQVDLATMTANVAQVFLGDDEWAAALRGIRAALRPGGRLAFETRRPERGAWREWTREHTLVRAAVPGVGVVETWNEVAEVRDDLVSFRATYVFADDGAVLTSASTLRFRSLEDVRNSLAAAGLTVEDVRDAPDRPGREWVVIARRAA